MSSNSAGFGRADRLHKSGEFVTLQRGGKRHQSEHFVLYGSAEGVGDTAGERLRLGITVSARIGNAVVRNRIKRRVRECYRQKLRAMLPAGTALVIIARRGVGELNWTAFDGELGACVANLKRKLGCNSDISRNIPQSDIRQTATCGRERSRD